MSEQKYYVFQKSLDDDKKAYQLVRCGFMSKLTQFVPCRTRNKDGRYENSFSKFTKSDLSKMMDGALYKSADYCEFMELPPDWVMNDKADKWLYEWINPLIELVPIEEED